VQQSRPVKRPKLVLLVVIDQFRYDYLTRFRADYTGGIDRLLKNGAAFTNAHLEHFPTVTAIGHSTVLSGATPSVGGIVGNEWHDRKSGAKVTSVSDPTVKLLGAGNKSGSSPHRLLVSTIGDELKMADKGKSRVIGISFKDRAAILPTGHMADGAYWFDNSTGNFVSSSFYFSELPGWVKEFNAGRVPDQYSGAQWKPVTTETDGKPFNKLPEVVGPDYYGSLLRTPFGNELLELFAERAIAAEQLGAREATDLLTVSLSSNDYVGHDLGPDAPEVRDISIRTDRLLEKFFRYIDSRVGMENVLVIMTADHGVAPLPELLAERKMPGGRMSAQALEDAVESALAAKHGEGKWVLYSAYGTFYLNRDLIRAKNLDGAEVQRAAVQALSKIPHVFRVYTRQQLMAGQFLRDPISRRVANGFNLQHSGDVITLLEPYWSFAEHGTTHGSAFSYDSHLPVVFMGPGIKPGRYDRPIAINDIAPTLATLLDIETPSGSVGQVLTEILAR
jgi:predicted AlkP superfamily pyrophosphatase or phosphodiesterase